MLDAHPAARLHGIDASAGMLEGARMSLDGRDATFEVGRIEDALPAGPFHLVVSALTVHHLDGPGKRALFERIAEVLAPRDGSCWRTVCVPVTPGEDARAKTASWRTDRRGANRAGLGA